jgi:hypothetical protein
MLFFGFRDSAFPSETMIIDLKRNGKAGGA